jgi:uncharacterized repeat protein (TIGR01451 family)
MHKFSVLLLVFALVGLLLVMPVSWVSAVDYGVLLTKVASSDNATLGDNITYTYTITNNTADNLTGLKLVDDKIGQIEIPVKLPAGGSITATRSYVVSPNDYSGNATKLVNIATFTSAENITATVTRSVALNLYQAALQVTKEADKSVAALGDVITYTYNVSNTGAVEIKDISLTDDPLGNIALLSDNVTVTRLDPGESIIAKATYTVVFDDLRAGSIKNTATVTGTDPNGKAITANSGKVEVSTNVFISLMTKAGILKASGVPGKGIDKAPGLQKPFNPNSQASEHAGKKDIKRNVQTDNSSEMNSVGEQEQEHEQEQEMNSSGEQNQEQEQEQEIDGCGEQEQEQEMNSNNRQDGKQEMNKNKEKGKGNGHGNNK